jgi:hypothetical protein
MSVLPWGTMNDWQRLEVEERVAKEQRRLLARATRTAGRTQAAPVVHSSKPAATTQPAMSQADCTEAA